MHDHSGRLVDHDDVGILIEDFQRSLFGLNRRRHRLRQVYDNAIANMHGKIWPHLACANPYSPVRNELLDLRSGVLRQNRDEEPIETLPCRFSVHRALEHARAFLRVLRSLRDLRIYAATLRRRGIRCGVSGVERRSQISIAIASGSSSSEMN